MSRRTRTLATALALALGLGACVNPPRQNYRSNYQSTSSEGVQSDSWNNLVELGFQDTIGPDFEYRITERLGYSEQRFEGNGVDLRTQEFLHQPSVDLLTTFGFLRWIQGYEFQSVDRQVRGVGDQDILRTDFLQQLEWEPENLPHFRLRYNRRTNDNDLFTDRVLNDAIFEIEHFQGPFDFEYSFEIRDAKDNITGQEADRTAHLLRANHSDSYFEGKLSSSLSVFIDERRLTDSGGGGSGSTSPVLPVAGLSEIDSTPQIASLPSNPALIDGDRTTSAGINIGGFPSGGEINWNMAVEVPNGAIVDELRLYTAAEVDILLVEQFSFSVWASNDNNFWTLVSPSAQFTYERAFEPYFRISLPTVASRYVKVVNTATPVTSDGVFVTELEPFTVTAAAPRSTQKTDNSIRNVTGSLSWRPFPAFLLTYNLFFQNAGNARNGTQVRDEQRIDNGLTGLWTPHDKVDVTLRAESQTVRDPLQIDTNFLFVNGLLTYRPLETLDATLNYTATQRDRDGEDDLDTNAAEVATSAQLLDTLQASVGFAVNDQKDFRNDRDIQQRIWKASLNAEMTDDLDLVLSLLNNDSTVKGPGAEGIPDPSEERYKLTLIYKPSTRLAANAELSWVDTFAGSGIDQLYRLDWLPFQDGALDVQLNVGRLAETSTIDQEINRYQALMRWTFNPAAFLELNFAVREQNEVRTDLFSVSFNATI